MPTSQTRLIINQNTKIHGKNNFLLAALALTGSDLVISVARTALKIATKMS